MRWHFVTANPGKAREARKLAGFPLTIVHLSLEEIQGATLKEVVKFKAIKAFEILQKKVIVEDTALALEGYGFFPGPYIKWLLYHAGVEGIISMARGANNWGARAYCALMGYDGEKFAYAEGICPGTISPVARGDKGFGWDSVFIPHHADKTFSQMDVEEKNRWSHRGKAWGLFRDTYVIMNE